MKTLILAAVLAAFSLLACAQEIKAPSVEVKVSKDNSNTQAATVRPQINSIYSSEVMTQNSSSIYTGVTYSSSVSNIYSYELVDGSVLSYVQAGEWHISDRRFLSTGLSGNFGQGQYIIKTTFPDNYPPECLTTSYYLNWADAGITLDDSFACPSVQPGQYSYVVDLYIATTGSSVPLAYVSLGQLIARNIITYSLIN
jgi:hypothetical protein